MKRLTPVILAFLLSGCFFAVGCATKSKVVCPGFRLVAELDKSRLQQWDLCLQQNGDIVWRNYLVVPKPTALEMPEPTPAPAKKK